MATVQIDNGKRIDELVEIHHLTGPSYFLVSDVHITRRISLETLRNEFNGDDAVDNLGNVYYSVEKINELLDQINNNAFNLSNRLDLTDSKYSDYYNDIVEEIAKIWNDIEDRYQFLFKWIDTLDAREARHYENLCEWIYKLRNDIRERLRDLDYREMEHWADHDNRILSLEYRMRDCEKRLDDYAYRIDQIELWKHITSSFTHIRYNGISVNNNNNFDNILVAIDNVLIDHENRITAIENWKNITGISLDMLPDINGSSSLLDILTAINKALGGLNERTGSMEEMLEVSDGGWNIRVGPNVPDTLPGRTIYIQYF